jgi:Cu(I)/Ag(I) efflux system membrane fusion protein
LLVTVQNLIDAKRSNNPSLLASARNRLELLDIDDAQIDEILASGKAETHLVIRSPIAGHVINKYVREGQYVQEGTALYDVADLRTVWIEAQIYEDDMPFLPSSRSEETAVGDKLDVVATTRAFPNETFRGKLTFIYPHVDEATRTVTVRFELDNPDHKLRPGSTATVTVKVRPKDLPFYATANSQSALVQLKEGKLLAVPEGTIIDTGNQKIVYRESSPGVFEGVEIKVGPKMSAENGVIFYPILAGLNVGDRIVTSGSFLVDAETRLNPALGSVYFGSTGGAPAKTTRANMVKPSTPEDPEAKVAAVLAQLSPEDRKLVDEQQLCPNTKNRLGTMGPPVKVVIEGQVVFLCCDGCRQAVLANPKQTLSTVAELKQHAAAKVPK